MSNFILISRLVSLGAIPLILFTSGKLAAQSQNTQQLDAYSCVTANNSRGWSADKGEFAISREIFSHVWRVSAESNIVCRANRKYRTLRLDVAMPEDGTGVITVSVYSDGNKANAYTISGGKKGPMFFDITGARFFSIETKCDSANCSQFYVSRAELELAPRNPGSRNK